MRSLRNLEERIERFEARARLLQTPPLVTVDTLTWPDDDRLAYALGDDSTQRRLEAKYGVIVPYLDSDNPLKVAAIVITELPSNPAYEDTDEDDRPIDPLLAEAMQRRHAELSSLAEIDDAKARREGQQREIDRYLSRKTR